MEHSQFHKDGVVRADASKDFFLFMLVRDITLDDAVVDLVDNSVDAARFSHQLDLGSAAIEITLDGNRLSISDNCGGFSLQRAKDYVFRFGRDKDKPRPEDDPQETIGQFGVGLKRAIFKIGSVAYVTSRTKFEAFEVLIDVDDWRKDDKTWTFPYQKLQKQRKTAGTEVEIEGLHPLIKSQLENDVFLGDLKEKIRKAHYSSLKAGIQIKYNGKSLRPFSIQMISTSTIQPIRKIVEVADDVNLEIVAGVGESEPKDAGWYLFCNDRMVLAADQSSITGWGDTSFEGSSPKYHNQFARFRGVARFQSHDSRLLPWNTTKRGVDASHPAFQKGKAQLVESLKSVVRFLNALDKELDSADRPLRKEVEAAEEKRLVSFDRVKPSLTFVYPKPQTRKKAATVLTCRVLPQRAEALKEELQISTNEELANYCFDYTYDHFVGD